MRVARELCQFFFDIFLQISFRIKYIADRRRGLQPVAFGSSKN